MTQKYRENFIDFNIEIDATSDLYKVINIFSLEQSKKLQKRKDTIRRQAETLEKIIINLLKGYGAYRITLKKSKTDKSTRYNSNIHRSSYRRKALSFLESIGFCTYILGSWRGGRETTVSSTDKLLSYFAQYGYTPYSIKVEETIVIKDVDYSNSFIGTKFKVFYDDNDYTRYYRNTLETISSSIRSLDISYPYYVSSNGNNHYHNNTSYYPLFPLIGGQVYLDDKFTSLYRVFNDGSLFSGGRIFGGPWINMKKKQRKSMEIGGRQCCCVDYNSMAIMQLDAKDGRTIYSDDPYDIPGLENVPRKSIKKQIQRMINSTELPKSFQSQDKDIAKGFKGVDFEFANNAILTHLERISHYFGVGIGKKLMNEESSILIISLQKLISLNIPALPLHDAIITTNKNAHKVKKVMEDTFNRFYNTTGAFAEVEQL